MSNDYFSNSGAPATGSPGSSATIRAEFNSIAQGFDKLPPLTGQNSKLVQVNATGTGLEAGSPVPAGDVVGTTATQTLTNKTFSDDTLINSVRIGRGAGNIASNTSAGRLALNSNTTGIQNTAVGEETLNANVAGNNSTAVGRRALFVSTGSQNTAVGSSAGVAITTGIDNTVLGMGALTSNDTGSDHTAIGRAALQLSTGERNTGLGYFAGSSMTTGSKNVIIGTFSGIGSSLDFRTSNNHIVLSDGDGTVRMFFDGAGIGNFRNAVDVTSSTAVMGYFRSSTSLSFDQRLTITSAANVTRLDAAANGSGAASALAFSNGDTENMRIASNGNVGIGRTGPEAKLDILDNSANPALRITQTGTGNCLVVEDSASPDSTPLVVDGDGRILIHTSTAVPSTSTFNPKMQFRASGAAEVSVRLLYDNSTAGNASSIQFRKNAGSSGSPAAPTSGHWLGRINFGGYDGVEFFPFGGEIRGEADGTYSPTSQPTRLLFLTAPDGSSTPVEAMRITSGQGIQIARTAVTAPAASDGNVFSGTYTPTLTNTTNVATSSAFTTQYMRVGNVVTVSGRITMSLTTAGAVTEIQISLPIASSITTTEMIAGTSGVSTSNAAELQAGCGSIIGDTTNNRARLLAAPSVTSSRTHAFHFTYRVA